MRTNARVTRHFPWARLAQELKDQILDEVATSDVAFASDNLPRLATVDVLCHGIADRGIGNVVQQSVRSSGASHGISRVPSTQNLELR